MYTIDDGLKWLNLQIEPEKPVLSSVDCTYSSPFCEKPLLTKKKNPPVISEIGNQNMVLLQQADRAENKQQYSQQFAYFDTKHWLRHESAGSKALEPSVGFSIKFNEPVLITGVWWSASISSSEYGYLFKIKNVEFEMNGNTYEGNYLNNYERTYDAGRYDIGKEIVRLIQPAYTDEISFTGLYYKKSNLNWNWNDKIAFTFEVYGCDEFEMDAILCPEGWYSSRGYCIKAIGKS